MLAGNGFQTTKSNTLTKLLMEEKMENKTNVWLVAILALLIGGLIGAVLFSSTTVETKVVPVDKIVYVNVPVADNTTLDIKNKLFEDDQWESDALELAENRLDNEELADWLIAQNISIRDEDDFTSVVIDDSDVSDTDVEDQDAEVVLNLIVKYERRDGSHGKSYVDVTFDVNDGKIKDRDVSYALA